MIFFVVFWSATSEEVCRERVWFGGCGLAEWGEDVRLEGVGGGGVGVIPRMVIGEESVGGAVL